MWVSFDALCRLGAAVDADAAFRDTAPHALRDVANRPLRASPREPPSAPPSASSTASAFGQSPGQPLFATPASVVDDENAPPRRRPSTRATPRPASPRPEESARPKALSFASATPSVADELRETVRESTAGSRASPAAS